MQSRPEYNERWVQSIIEKNPSVLGLGNLALLRSEKRQFRGGRLDLLLEDTASAIRYEVELQLGATDPSHIIRCIEYWDYESTRHPKYTHRAVIVAEEITSRFFNVISLFNRAIPLIAIKVTALKVGDCTTLSFTKVLDISALSINDSEEDVTPVDRKWWEAASTPAIMSAADSLLTAAVAIQPTTAFKFTKSYIGTTVNGQASNYFWLIPQKRTLRASFYIEQSSELDQEIDESGLDRDSYDARYKNYRLRLTPEDIQEKVSTLRMLLLRAYKETEGEPLPLISTMITEEQLAGAAH